MADDMLNFNAASGLLSSNPVLYYQNQATSLDWLQTAGTLVGAGITAYGMPGPLGWAAAGATVASGAGSVFNVAQDVGYQAGLIAPYNGAQHAQAAQLGMLSARENPTLPGLQIGNDFGGPLIGSDYIFSGG